MSAEIAVLPVLHALLGSVRVLAMLLVGPIFNHPALGPRIRVMLALMIAWSAHPTAVGPLAGTAWSGPTLAGALALEILIGIAAGIGTSLVFAGFLQLGEFVATQGGLGAARSIDPVSGTSSVAIGMAFNTLAMLVFLSIGGHHEMIRGVVATFDAYPVGGGLPDTEILYEIARMGSVIYEVAFRIAGPDHGRDLRPERGDRRARPRDAPAESADREPAAPRRHDAPHPGSRRAGLHSCDEGRRRGLAGPGLRAAAGGRLMADEAEKTEDATPKKKEDARKKGQVAQSRDVSTVLLLVAATAAAISPLSTRLGTRLFDGARVAWGGLLVRPDSVENAHALLLQYGAG